MPSPLIAQIVWLTGYLQQLVARHGARGRLPGDVQLRVWTFVRDTGARVQAILERIAAGRLRRYPNRRRPVPGGVARKRPAPCQLPSGRGWMQRLMPELCEGAGNFSLIVQHPEMQRLAAQVPQLRRALAPFGRAFDIALPRAVRPVNPAPRPDPPRAPAPNPPRPVPTAPSSAPLVGPKPSPAARQASPATGPPATPA